MSRNTTGEPIDSNHPANVSRRIPSIVMNPVLRSLTLALAIGGPAILVSIPVFAGGMTLTMQNGSQLGQAYSGGAAAEDASTVFFNPAGLTFLNRPQIIATGLYAKLDGTFTNTGSLTGGAIPTAGSDSRDLGLDKFIPNLYLAYPFSEELSFGFGISAPFGLGTRYEDDWVGRYHALRSELTTINVNPAVGWQATEKLSLGFGLNWQHAEAELSNAIDFGLVGFSMGVPGFVPGGADGSVLVTGSDANFGVNFGGIYEFATTTRLGVHYRSGVSHRLSGRADFTDVPAVFAGAFPDQGAKAPLPLAGSISVSFYHDLTPDISIMADASRWNWSRLRTFSVDFEDPATPDLALPQNWDDSSIYSLGIRWRTSDRVTWRAGYAYNESPVSDPALRSPRIPDSDRVWLAIGATLHVSETTQWHFGYAHLTFKDSITANDDGFGHLLVGDFAVTFETFGTQFTWNF